MLSCSLDHAADFRMFQCLKGISDERKNFLWISVVDTVKGNPVLL
jgi:hypothetical protein